MRLEEQVKARIIKEWYTAICEAVAEDRERYPNVGQWLRVAIKEKLERDDKLPVLPTEFYFDERSTCANCGADIHNNLDTDNYCKNCR